MRLAIAVLLVTGLSGCALDTAEQKVEFTSFEPTSDGFHYKGHAYFAEPLDSPDAEKWRLDILQSYLSENAICPSGYDIISRKPILVTSGLGDNYAVYYEGRCK